MHVHVQCPDGESKFWLEPAITQAQNHGLSEQQLHAVNCSLKDTSVKSAALGKNTSGVEVLNVSPHGFWLLVDTEELFVAFDQFPWFRDATIGQISGVQLPSPNHLYWAALDVDLAVESIRHPEQFPLVSRAGT